MGLARTWGAPRPSMGLGAAGLAWVPDVGSMASLLSFGCRRVVTPALAMALLVRVPAGRGYVGSGCPRHSRGAPACDADLTNTGYTGHTQFHEVTRGFCPSPSPYIPKFTLWITGLVISTPKIATKIFRIMECFELGGIHKGHQLPGHQDASLPQYEVPWCGGLTEIKLIFFMQLETFLSHS